MPVRKPDNIVWSWPWTSLCVGWSFQKYGYGGAGAFTICLGILTIRWHSR